MRNAVINMAVESWRFGRVFNGLPLKLGPPTAFASTKSSSSARAPSGAAAQPMM